MSTQTVAIVSVRRRWAMLAASTFAQASAAVVTNGLAFLLPALHSREGLSLATGGVVVAMPTVGVMLTLVAWGWLADHRGERLALLVGLTAVGRRSRF